MMNTLSFQYEDKILKFSDVGNIVIEGFGGNTSRTFMSNFEIFRAATQFRESMTCGHMGYPLTFQFSEGFSAIITTRMDDPVSPFYLEVWLSYIPDAITKIFWQDFSSTAKGNFRVIIPNESDLPLQKSDPEVVTSAPQLSSLGQTQKPFDFNLYNGLK